MNDFLAHKGLVSSSLSRKIIHIGTGPLFVVCWLLFTDSLLARFLASLVPLAISVQFALVGFGIIKDQAAVDAMSRSGDRQEILRGPLLYGIMFVIITLVYWRNSPIGIIALMLLCGGDGLADIVGNRTQGARLPWSARKSWAGSLAMFLGGWTFAVLLVGIYHWAGAFSGSLVHYLPAITAISFFGSVIESLPFNDIDNVTVPVVAIWLGHLILP
ncbi:MAG: phosphatidate cytidylyltransferase [Anaerolineaceae bacterium]|nr:phosphatidate cytidylyltransferase [Anaerolineaceae bacterium]